MGRTYNDYVSAYNKLDKTKKQGRVVEILAQHAFLHDALFKVDYYLRPSVIKSINITSLTMENIDYSSKGILTEGLIRKLIRQKLIWRKK